MKIFCKFIVRYISSTVLGDGIILIQQIISIIKFQSTNKLMPLSFWYRNVTQPFKLWNIVRLQFENNYRLMSQILTLVSCSTSWTQQCLQTWEAWVWLLSASACSHHRNGQWQGHPGPWNKRCHNQHDSIILNDSCTKECLTL